MSGFDPVAKGVHSILTTRPPWFPCKMAILFNYYSVNPNPKKKLTANPNHDSQGLTLISLVSASVSIRELKNHDDDRK